MKDAKIFAFIALTAAVSLLFMFMHVAPAGAAKDNPTVDLCGMNAARTIAVRDGKFFVVIHNRTRATLTIWGEQCSWGWGNISFEVRAGEKVISVERDEINWKRNAPQPVQLLPGDTIVREIRFDDRTWHWEKVTEFCKDKSYVVISAKLKIDDDTMAKAEKVWIGTVRSSKSCELESR